MPALPTVMQQGSVKGLVARGDFIVNINWQNNELTTADLFAKQNASCKIKIKNHYKIYLNDKPVLLKNEGNNIYSFYTQKNKTYIVRK